MNYWLKIVEISSHARKHLLHNVLLQLSIIHLKIQVVQPNAGLSEPCSPLSLTDQTSNSYPVQSTSTNCVSPF